MNANGLRAEGHDHDMDRKFKMWRLRAFIGTWIAYAGFYLCRKNISIGQNEFMKEFGWGTELVGVMLTGYHFGYAIGQFVNGTLSDRYGPWRVLALGFISTIILNVLFGFSHSITVMGVLWTLNGYAQSCGWPAVIKGMANWFSIRERGKVMGLWGASYAIGDMASTALAAYVISHVAVKTVALSGSPVTFADWRWVFWIAAIVLTVVAVISLMLFRNKPSDVGLPEIEEYHNLAPALVPQPHLSVWEKTREILSNKPIWVLATSYMGVKFIRYTFLSWSVTYLAQARGMGTAHAGYVSTIYSFAGLFGAWAASYLSDKVFASRRAPITVIMMLGLMFSLIFFYQASPALLPLAIGLVGFMTYGPDIVISGVAVMDFGSKDGAGTTAGFVNGVGALGQAMSGIIVGILAQEFGWNSVFFVLIGISFACAMLLSTIWSKVGKN